MKRLDQKETKNDDNHAHLRLPFFRNNQLPKKKKINIDINILVFLLLIIIFILLFFFLVFLLHFFRGCAPGHWIYCAHLFTELGNPRDLS